MATEIKLPDLGEGVEDATISRWLVKEGDTVDAGDSLLEIATDKVDTEVPSPVGGTVLKIQFGEGALVPAGAVIALLGEAGESVDAGEAQAEAPAPQATPAPVPERPATVGMPSENGHGVKASPVAKRVAADRGVDLEGLAGTGPGGRITKDDVLSNNRQPGEEGAPAAGETTRKALPGDQANVAPLSVLRLAADYNVDLAEIAGDRPLSTLNRYDVLNVVASRTAGKAVTVEPVFLPTRRAPGAAPTSPAVPSPSVPAQPQSTTPATAPKPEAKAASAPVQIGAGEELVKHSRMRAAIAKSVSSSLYTAPHVTTMWDVNMSAVLAHRKAHKGEFAKQGVNLTITAYFIQAIIAGLKAVPAANATYTDEGVIIKRSYNIGMAVALPMDANGLGGLIVPVIKGAGELNLVGLARAVNDLAEKARNNQLKSEDLADGTFTLSNYGTSGSTFQTPIIVQPQVGILGVGAIEKRPVVVSQGHPLEANTGDYLAFLPMTTLGFSYDHRVLDGATADAFCAAVKQALEGV
jgi:2-oxoglutarate dehydrogenase E2 component (dihydrolipoamide succinyltransferase)